MSDPSPQANRVRTNFARFAVFEAAFAALMLVVGVTNAATGFIGHAWYFSVVPLALGVLSLRTASVLWNIRDRVAAGHERLAAMDEVTRQARRRRARRIVAGQLGVMAVISVIGAAAGGWLGFFVALFAMFGALELLGLAVKLRGSRGRRD